MKIIPELKKIACLNSRIDHLADVLSKKIDDEVIDFRSAVLVSGLHVEGQHLYNRHGLCLDNCGLVDDLYYCWQCEDGYEYDYFGTMYFKTDVPGQYVAVQYQT